MTLSQENVNKHEVSIRSVGNTTCFLVLSSGSLLCYEDVGYGVSPVRTNIELVYH